MEKESPYQLELFSSSKESSCLKDQRLDNLFFNFVRNYEKTILVIIGIVTASIISFGLGVEKGKKITIAKPGLRLDMATGVSSRAAPVVTATAEKSAPSGSAAPGGESVKAEEQSAPKLLKQQGYVIQLASYKQRNLADKEAEALKKKGFSALILKKGSFTVLYVGHFASKESASSMLSELRKRYGDCYVRRL
ncbi:MAG: SPOR domain-containing protein [Candidatus Omnitrophota bacterium]